MIGTALRASPVGANLDRAPAYGRLGAIAVPTFVVQGNLDFPHIQARSRHIAAVMPGGSWHEMTDIAHLPALEQPEKLADLLSNFLVQHLG